MKKVLNVLFFVFLLVGIATISSCKKDVVVVPTLSTTNVTVLTTSTASSGGVITQDGGALVRAKGICWGTSSGPTILPNGTLQTNNGTGTDVFTGTMTGLKKGNTYYVRAYATNSAGVGYGNEVSVTF